MNAIRKVYRDVTMRVQRDDKRTAMESWLPEIVELVVGTGRRISAVCALRVEDLELERTARTPHGAIVWPEDTDKLDREWRCPISERVREAVDCALFKRRRLGIAGNGPLFPSAEYPSEPVAYETVRVGLEEAETKAELEPQEGGLWHPYRRLWASARKDLPNVDVARTGGWASLEALQRAYQRPDDATMLRVVEHNVELREVQ